MGEINIGTYINVMQTQLDIVKQSNKHMNGARGEKGKLQGSVILTTNIVKLERLISEALKEMENQGVDVEKCRQSLILR